MRFEVIEALTNRNLSRASLLGAAIRSATMFSNLPHVLVKSGPKVVAEFRFGRRVVAVPVTPPIMEPILIASSVKKIIDKPKIIIRKRTGDVTND